MKKASVVGWIPADRESGDTELWLKGCVYGTKKKCLEDYERAIRVRLTCEIVKRGQGCSS